MCLLSHNVITTCINLHLFCEICFWTLIEIFYFYTMSIIFVRWRLSVGIKRFTYLLSYYLLSIVSVLLMFACISMCFSHILLFTFSDVLCNLSKFDWGRIKNGDCLTLHRNSIESELQFNSNRRKSASSGSLAHTT